MFVERLEIQGFKSFKEREVITFKGNHPGLYFLTGENKLEESLGANGVGKSTIFDALCFVLFGKSSRGLKAGDVGAWNSKKKCEVVVHFYLDTQKYIIKRTWQPNALLWHIGEGAPEWEEVTQEKIEEATMFSFESFLHSILISQHGTMFLDMSPADKTTLFSSVLTLDNWLEASKNAKSKADMLQGIVLDLRADIQDVLGRIAGLRDMDFTQKKLVWEEERKESLQVLRNRKTAASKNVKDARTALAGVSKKLSEVKEILLESKESAAEIEDSLEANSKILRKVESAIAGKNSTIASFTKERKKFTDAEESCPYCGQEMDPKHLKKELALIDKEVSILNDAIAILQNQMDTANKARKGFRAALEEAREVKEDVEAEYRLAESKHSRLTGDISSYEKEVLRCNTDINDLEEAVNPHVSQEKERDERVVQLQTSVAKTQDELLSTEQGKVRVEYWVKGFKEVRMFLIEEALKQLEVEVNNSLRHLGLLDWKISFAMDEETKSGSVHKGFSVFVSSPYNDKKVRWESWSGGESQRLRLAGTMGLVNLISNRRGYPTNIEIWDEPSNFLSEQGITDLLDTLADRSTELEKQLWVIDHRSLQYGGFEKTVKVVKDETGSHIVEQEFLYD